MLRGSLKLQDSTDVFIRAQEANITLILIENQNIPILRNSLFKITEKIKTLYIKKDNIKEIEKNIFSNQNITNNIIITENKIPVIKRKTFVNLLVVSLELTKNEIEIVENEAFFNLTNLHDIRLQYNKIKELNQFAYCQLQNFHTLDISENIIDDLEPENLSFIQEDNFELLITNNRIYKLEHNILNCVQKKFLSVFLDNNFLETLPDGIFNNHTLNLVSLTSNPFTNISRKICDESCFINSLRFDEKCLKSYCNKNLLKWAKSKKIELRFTASVSLRNSFECKKSHSFIFATSIFILRWFKL